MTHINKWFNNSIDKFKYELYDHDSKISAFIVSASFSNPGFNYNNKSYLNLHDLFNIFKIFEQKCEFNFKRYILRNLELFEITDKELLIENDEWKLKRISLKKEIDKYNNCKTIIANL